MVWIKIITRFVYQTIIKNRPYDMIRYKQIVMLILGKKDWYTACQLQEFNSMQNDMVKGMKAVKALWGLAHINNHIKILPPISFLIDKRETKSPTFKEYRQY